MQAYFSGSEKSPFLYNTGIQRKPKSCRAFIENIDDAMQQFSSHRHRI